MIVYSVVMAVTVRSVVMTVTVCPVVMVVTAVFGGNGCDSCVRW